jgi:U3 small nucleolar ribonucleoprotein protein IMP4
MTLVTTSRKAVPEVRTIARAFAAATGSGFVTRGKRGLPDLFTLDPHIILFSRESRGIRVQFFSDESTVADYRIMSVAVEHRDGTVLKGLGVSNPDAFAILAQMITVSPLTEPAGSATCILDGPQRKRYRFRLVPYGT